MPKIYIYSSERDIRNLGPWKCLLTLMVILLKKTNITIEK